KCLRSVIGNFDPRRRSSNSHGRNWGVHLHVPGLRDLAGNEGEGALDQIKRAGIRLTVWVVDKLVQLHASVARQIEGGAIGKGDTELSVGASLDHVALEDEVTDLGPRGAGR